LLGDNVWPGIKGQRNLLSVLPFLGIQELGR
jgi:hypothetical protein